MEELEHESSKVFSLKLNFERHKVQKRDYLILSVIEPKKQSCASKTLQNGLNLAV